MPDPLALVASALVAWLYAIVIHEIGRSRSPAR